MPKLLALILFFGFYIFPANTYAVENIVINEFMSNVATGTKEWVEFYNPGSSAVSLDGWFLEERTGSDLAGVSQHSLEGITVPSLGFAVYEFSTAKLNNGGDILTLKNGTTVIDEIAYGSAANSNINSPEKGQSAGRQSDAGSNWVIFSEPTRNTTNNSAEILESPSPEPVVSSNLSTPTTQPKTSAKSPTPSPKVSPKTASVLGTSKETSQSSTLSALLTESSPTPITETEATQSNTKIAGILTGGGLILVGLSILSYFWYKRRSKGKDENQTESEP